MITIGIFEAKGSLGQLAQSAAEGGNHRVDPAR